MSEPQSPAVLLPPPAGVHFIQAHHDEALDAWLPEVLPLAAIKVLPDEQHYPLDALSVFGDWLVGNKTGLLLADGRVVVPDNAIYPSVDDWLAHCKALDETFRKKYIFMKKA
jgi:hypothetical protein